MTNETRAKLLAAAYELHTALQEEIAKPEPYVFNMVRLQAAASSHILVVLMAIIDELAPAAPAPQQQDPRQRQLF